MKYASTLFLMNVNTGMPFGVIRTNDDLNEIKDLVEQASENWKANEFDLELDSYILNCLDNHGYKYDYEEFYKNIDMLFI